MCRPLNEIETEKNFYRRGNALMELTEEIKIGHRRLASKRASCYTRFVKNDADFSASRTTSPDKFAIWSKFRDCIGFSRSSETLDFEFRPSIKIFPCALGTRSRWKVQEHANVVAHDALKPRFADVPGSSSGSKILSPSPAFPSGKHAFLTGTRFWSIDRTARDFYRLRAMSNRPRNKRAFLNYFPLSGINFNVLLLSKVFN